MNSHRTFESVPSPTKSDKSARVSTPRLTGSPEKTRFEINEQKALVNIEKRLIGKKGKSTSEIHEPGLSNEISNTPVAH